MKFIDEAKIYVKAGDDIRGATDFGPRGGQATALGLLADADTTRPRAHPAPICWGKMIFSSER
jgi:hypothetical protein